MIVMAAPEVPLAAREKLLEMGKQNSLFCSAAFTTGEINKAIELGMMENTDLLALNLDEASAVAGKTIENPDTLSVVNQAIKNLQKRNEKMMISVTAGKDGSYCWDGMQLNWTPAVKTEPVSTAGAGDAFFAGILAGLTLGLHLFDAQQLASLVAGLSVTSPDTIHKGIDRDLLYKLLNKSGLNLSGKIIKLLEE